MERIEGISVIIRTFKRPDLLEKILSRLLLQAVPSHRYEIVVVDNDNFRSGLPTVKRFIGRSDVTISYFVEPKVSNSRTANLGIRQSRNDIVAFIDDDAIPEPNWLTAITKSFQQPHVHILCGKVKLDSQVQLPAWLTQNHRKLLGELNFGETPRETQEKEFPLLGNFAVRKKVFQDVGMFPEKTGYQENRPLGGEETAFAILARRQGYRIYYNPDMVVRHQVSSNKLKRLFFIKRKFWEGRVTFVIDRMTKSALVVVGTIFIRGVFFCALQAPLLFLKPGDYLTIVCRASRNFGYVVEAFSFKWV
ncbi:MAG: glycosyltransferase [Candidatus Omnitrophica bacterium]|nr:glycosyltransferase [Candidatus Omnitrophota bacterium]